MDKYVKLDCAGLSVSARTNIADGVFEGGVAFDFGADFFVGVNDGGIVAAKVHPRSTLSSHARKPFERSKYFWADSSRCSAL